MHTITKFLTDFADQAVILPLVITLTLALVAQRWWRGALAWVVATAATFAIMLVLKVGFIACSRDHLLYSPSGHVAAASVVAGGMAILLLRWRPSVLPLAILAALVVGISRILLGMHSLPEVVVGAMVGLAGATFLLWAAGPVPASLSTRSVVAVSALVVVLMHGFHLPAEAHITRYALHMRHTMGCETPPLSIFSLR